MFSKDSEAKLPRLADLVPQIAAEVDRLAALTPGQLADEIMTKAFKPEYTPDSSTELGSIVSWFLPDHAWPKLGDTTSLPEFELRDVIAEGVQVLEQARLLRPTFGYSGAVADSGWTTTRLGRAALTSGSVQAAVEHLITGVAR